MLGLDRDPQACVRLAQLEAADQHPRHLVFEQRIGAEYLGREFVDTLPWLTRLLYRRLPPWIRQVLATRATRHGYDAVVSWGERLSLLFALMLKLSASRTRHVALLYWMSPPRKALLLRLVASHIDHIVTWSSVQHEIAIRRLRIPASRMTLTCHPVDQRFWRPMGRRTDMVCAAGNEMRDYATLIEAMRGLDIPCHIAAREVPSGTSRKVATPKTILDGRELPPNVTVGSKTYPELRDLYARSRFVIVPLKPTDTDNGVTTILEAMAMSRAVICSRVAGQVDVIVEGKTGLFVPQGDSRALREAILFLWAHPEVAERMGREGRRRVEERHTIDQFAETVRGVIERVIAEPRLAVTWT
jgi:glycosyltransferase involved in cell wall biosynthesis